MPSETENGSDVQEPQEASGTELTDQGDSLWPASGSNPDQDLSFWEVSKDETAAEDSLWD